ncbi:MULTISPECIES: putative holin-like toxin [Paenibacillus]
MLTFTLMIMFGMFILALLTYMKKKRPLPTKVSVYHSTLLPTAL